MAENRNDDTLAVDLLCASYLSFCVVFCLACSFCLLFALHGNHSLSVIVFSGHVHTGSFGVCAKINVHVRPICFLAAAGSVCSSCICRILLSVSVSLLTNYHLVNVYRRRLFKYYGHIMRGEDKSLEILNRPFLQF